ncbi:MAG: winged helix-turn-helix transcriptional regulator [Saprospiraceae bacterium]|nr:winged helix-turn-helix transcriptional regulator [Saprospiraceae bacterium]
MMEAKGSTKKEIAEKLNITQGRVSERLKRAGYEEIMALLKRYRELVSLNNQNVMILLVKLLLAHFLDTNHWEAAGFLPAAKSVFRFGDLKESKDRKFTGYILIGTLISYGLAILIGIFYTRFS